MTESRAKKSQGFFRQCIELIGLLLLVFLIRTFFFGLYQVPTGSMEVTMLVGERFLADKFSYWVRKPKVGEIVAFIQPIGRDERPYKFNENPVIEFFERHVGFFGFVGPENWTKRIIAGPGDFIRGTIEDGIAVIYVNDVKISEPYLNKYPLIKRTMGLHERSFDPSLPLNQQPFYKLTPDEVATDFYGNYYLIYPSQVKKSKTDPALRDDRFRDGSDEFSVKLKNDEYWLMGDNRRGSKDSRFFGPVKQRDIFARITWLLFSIDSNESWLIIDMLKNPIKFWSKIRPGRNLRQIS